MDIAITCIAHDGLRTVAGLAARHAGYRVLESKAIKDAITIASRAAPDLMLIGSVADPNGELARWCSQQGIRHHIVSPRMSALELSDLFSAIRAVLPPA